ncbi:DEAD-box ATP-dependent RNA helicase 7 [Vigna unguiculata]|nr:DEAD-box ATP-dependent RNA helicase 7 [Vigna unguiculata]
MPSVSLSVTDTTLQENKKLSAKKAKNQSPIIAEKKSASKLLSDPNTPDPDQDGVSGKLQKKAKKRKASDIEAMAATNDADEDTGSELVEPESSREDDHKKKKKKKKAKSEEQPLVMEAEEKEEKKEDPNAVSKFRISEPLRLKLKEKGIESLFPIQAMTFDLVLDGSDLVGRARTGQGKTLAFVLPILESLINGPAKSSRKTGYGRTPSVLVLLPTRELACQVHADFEVYGGAMGLSSCCLYGGAPYNTQEIKLRRGVDIVIGTPGRVKDHIERGNIDLSQLKFRVLDEADEMLRMGFVEDVELILGKVENVNKVQTLLFSATLPDWVKHIAAQFLKPDKKTADLVGNTKMKASTNVRHIVLPCSASARSQLIPDIIRCYSSGGRTIIFTETKESASQLAGLLPGARALHGDIQQAQREVTLSGFRSGKFMTLVATNVAARGLDINDVQLIIQCEFPREVESYIHRSGRTGRAGNTGVAVTLYDPKRSNISKIERESGVKFEHISAPRPDDIAKAVGGEAAEMITQVSDSVIPAFKETAEELLKSSGLTVVELLAKALAKAVGYTEIKQRSLLTSMENYVTLLLEIGKPIFTPSFAYGILRRFLPEEKVEAVKGLSLTADGNGAVFDVPAEDLDTYLSGQENAANVSLEVLKALPRLQQRDQSRGGRFGDGGRGGGNRFGRGGGGRNGRFSNDRFSNGGGRGGRGNWGGKRW